MTGVKNGVRKILIFFVPTNLSEAYEAIFGQTGRTIRLVVSAKEIVELTSTHGYEIFQLKRGETIAHLVGRIFGIDRDQIEAYSNPRELYRALQEATGHAVVRE